MLARGKGLEACLAGHQLHMDEVAFVVVDNQHVGMAGDG
jgi:hypothetical protein